MNNPYFSISNYADSCAAHAAVSLRARLSEKWCSPDLLGSKNKSKTIQIRDFDSDPSDPQIAQMVLSAWMLHRVQMNGFIGKNKSRKIWLDSEMKNLKQKVGAGTGCQKADALIREWLPGML